MNLAVLGECITALEMLSSVSDKDLRVMNTIIGDNRENLLKQVARVANVLFSDEHEQVSMIGHECPAGVIRGVQKQSGVIKRVLVGDTWLAAEDVLQTEPSHQNRAAN